MTRALPFTEASLRRAIKALRKEGLRVTGVRLPDGSAVIVDGDKSEGAIVSLAPDGQASVSSKWEDIQA